MKPAGPPQNAASVILFRPVEDGSFEVFLGRPAPDGRTAGAAYTFPRRVVTREDSAEVTLRRSRGISRDEARKILGAELRPALALAHWVAGVRVLFEGLGVFLCVAQTGNPPPWGEPRKKLLARRRELLRGETSFGSILDTEGLFCDLSQLRYFSHWLETIEAPASAHVRYFLARLPAHQGPVEVVRSLEDGLWITPDRAFAAHQRRELPLTFSVFASLRTLADFDSWQSLCTEYGLDPLEPQSPYLLRNA